MRPAIVGFKNVNCHLSDHNCIVASFQPGTPKRCNSYWKMNTSYLKDPDYISMITSLWLDWRQQKTQYTDLNLWWDYGKIKLKQASQLYGIHKKKAYTTLKNTLQAELQDIEQTISKNSDPEIIERSNRIKAQLNELSNQYTHASITIAQSIVLNESDTCSRFFFEIEKTKAQTNSILHLKDEKQIVTDPDLIKEKILSFYTQLYSPEPVEEDMIQKLCQQVTPLSELSAVNLETPITLDEVLEAIKLQNNNKTPGLDGIPADFYKCFAELLAPDLLDMYLFSLEKGILPISSRRAVISLLPKSGDLGLITNWRPVSILCSDMKIFTRIIMNRLKPFLNDIIGNDQAYSIPGRYIHDNLHLIRDLVSLANIQNKDLALVNLDQKKAFDRVNHHYLFQLLKAYNFHPYFLSLIQLAYADPSFILKINNSLTAPSPFRRGLRQGCSLSAALYVLAIEPLLNLIRNNNDIYGFSFLGHNAKISAYADDITCFITRDTSWQPLAESLAIYEKASNASVNLQKSRGFWAGAWKNRLDSPLEITWTNQPIKLLGIILGNCNTSFLNYEKVIESTKNTLKKWIPIAKALSYRGRMLVINQLCAPRLWHKFRCINPPEKLLDELRKIYFQFFWQGTHWVKKELMALPLEEGGQGIIDLRARLFDFKLTYLSDYLKNLAQPRHPCFQLMQYFLQNINDLRYDFQLFICTNHITFPKCMYLDMYYTFFFRDLRKKFIITQKFTELTTNHILHQHLLYNTCIDLSGLQVHADVFIKAGITRLADLLGADYKYINYTVFKEKMNLTSERIAKNLFNKLLNALPPEWRKKLVHYQYISSRRYVSDVIPELQVSSLDKRYSSSLIAQKQRAFYFFFLHCAIPDDCYFSIPIELAPDDSPDYNFYLNTYARPNQKKYSDIQWRFLNKAFFPGNKLFSLGFSASPDCLFCHSPETALHVFLYCPRLISLFRLLKCHITKIIGEPPPVSWWIYGPPFVLTARKPRIINWLIISAKTAIWLTRAKKLHNSSPTDTYGVYIGILKTKLSNECHMSMLQGKFKAFKKKWRYGSFFSIDNDGNIKIREF